MTTNTNAPRPDDGAAPEPDVTGITVAERTQLVAATRGDDLLPAPPFALSTAVLIELCLRARLGSVASTGFFTSNTVNLTVLDATPTGNPVLDVALARIAARTAPRAAETWIKDLWSDVSAAVVAELARRRIATVVLTPKGRASHLHVDAIDWVAAERRRISQARAVPDGVTDPLLGAVIDVVDHFGDAFSPEFSARAFVPRGWYPAAEQETILAILRAEVLVSGMQ